MSAPERVGRAGWAGRGQHPSAAPEALPADASSVDSASSRAGGGAALLAAAAPPPGAAEQPPAFAVPRAATPGAADAPRAGLAALSLHSPGPGDDAVGGDAQATRPAPPPALASRSAGGAAYSSPSAGVPAYPVGAVARGGGALGQGPAAAAAPPASAGAASVPGDGPPVPVGDDGLPLSAEAAASPFSPPASERHAAFLKLLDHRIEAGLNKRHMRGADFSALAAEAGVPLFGGDSVIVANLRAGQAISLTNQAAEESDPAERAALRRRAWAVLLAQALPVLQSRLDKDTLLPGKLRKAEEAYYVYEQQTTCWVTEQPVPDAAELHCPSRLLGYDTALLGALMALILLPMPVWRSDERGRAQAFVLATLRLIPKTAGLLDEAAYELNLVDKIERFVTPSIYGIDFCASVLAVWRSRAVVDVMRSRGSPQGAFAEVAADDVEFDVRQQADVAERGLRRCALPSCGKQEATVLQFRVCGHCQTTRYCCPEHAKQHWKAHKREYEAEEEERGEGGDGGGAGA